MGVHARTAMRPNRPEGRVRRNEEAAPIARVAASAQLARVTRAARIAAAALGVTLTAMAGTALAQTTTPVPAATPMTSPGLAPAPAAASASVYKWVDADGRTHYSQRKPTEPGARASEIKPPPPPPDSPPLRKESWVAAPSLASPTAAASPEASAPTAAGLRTSRVYALSEGLDPNTDAYRCALAKDVLSGAVRRSAMRPTDDHDRNIARNDIKLFCK